MKNSISEEIITSVEGDLKLVESPIGKEHTLESAIHEARRSLDMFNLEVAKERAEKGMSDAFEVLYKNLGRLDRELKGCLTWAGYLDTALKEIKEGG